MGKRSDFEPMPRDLYLTPMQPVQALGSFLPKGKFTYSEPCAGDGRLISHISNITDKRGTCTHSCDIVPLEKSVSIGDATNVKLPKDVDMVITNPPWSRNKASGYLLHNIITNLSDQAPTWLLFDSDWVHTVQAGPYLERLMAVVSVGRVKWFENTNMSGKDNVCWHLFDKDARKLLTAPQLFGRKSTQEDKLDFVTQLKLIR